MLDGNNFRGKPLTAFTLAIWMNLFHNHNHSVFSVINSKNEGKIKESPRHFIDFPAQDVVTLVIDGRQMTSFQRRNDVFCRVGSLIKFLKKIL